MARIPEEEIERIKRHVSVQQLAESSGVVLKAHGSDFIGLCPRHADREPSLVISPKKNLWHCLGACQTGGSAIDWVMQQDRLSFRDAVEQLQRDFPHLVARPVVSVAISASASSPRICDEQDLLLLREVVGFYHETLKRHPDGLDYLKLRGLECQEMVSHFQLGFANRTLGKRFLADRADGRDRLIRLGLIRESGHEHFNGSLVIPVLDLDGQVTEMYGRKTGTAFHAGTPLHLYLPGAHRGVFNEKALVGVKDVILCEALMDALTFWCADIHNVTSSYGIEGFTPDHLAAFKRHGVERVFIAYDRDDAGERAAVTLAARLFAEGLECFRVQFPKGMDANAYAQKVQPAKRSLGLVIEKAVWMGESPRPRPTDPRPALSPVTAPLPAPPSLSEAPTPTFSPLAAEPPTAVNQTTPEVKGDEVKLRMGERTYQIRGFAKNTGSDHLKVNLFLSQGSRFFVDTFDLYAAKHRASFLRQASEELTVPVEVLKRELDQVLLQLEALKTEALEKALGSRDAAPVVLTEAERDAALELLRAPNLCDRILADFERSGVVGEETNKLMGYLACVSRKLEAPLGVVIQSSSAAGKSSLMEAILALIPKEEQVKYSAMTGQSLFYMQGISLIHKVLAIAEEEGAKNASYALKLLQSEGELTIAATGKDPMSGKLTTQEYRVEGPVMLFLTTTAIDLDEELLNRCIVLSVDEDRQQTRAIQRRQRQAQTLDGLLTKQDRERVIKLHQNAQRLLRPLRVVNPYAERLTFLDNKTRTRRDHAKYLTLIRAIALLHQYQRPIHRILHYGEVIEYIEVAAEDITLANRLAHEVLGRSLDELPPQTRRMLEALDLMVDEMTQRLGMTRSDCRFSRRDVRERTGFGNTQLKIHLNRLQDLEYLIPHRGTRGQSFVYELAYDGQSHSGDRFLPLIDVEDLLVQVKYDKKLSGSATKLSGSNTEFAGSNRAQIGAKSGPSRGAENGSKAAKEEGLSEVVGSNGEKSTDTVQKISAVVPLNGVVPRNGHAAPSPLAAQPVVRVD